MKLLKGKRHTLILCAVPLVTSCLFYLVQYHSLVRSYYQKPYAVFMRRISFESQASSNDVFHEGAETETNTVVMAVESQIPTSYPKTSILQNLQNETDHEIELREDYAVNDDNNREDDDDDNDDDDGDDVDEEVNDLIADYDSYESEEVETGIERAGNTTETAEEAKPEFHENEEEDAAKWYQEIESRFRTRLARVKDVCAKYNNPGKSQAYTKANLLYYSQRYDMLVCLCAKVGTSTWKSHLLHMRDINPATQNVHTNYWERKIKAKNILGQALDQHIKTSTKVMTTRHPLERLVSAFRDKFLDGKAVDKPQSSGHYRYFWKPAMRSLHQTKRADGKLQITFIEFLKYVVLNQSKRSLGDRHWSRLYRSCSICSFGYDYFMRLETYTQDLSYLKYKFNISELNVYDRRHSKSDSASRDISYSKVTEITQIRPSTLEYYREVPPSLLAKIFSIYKTDFEMFNYEIPTELRKMVQKEAIK